jgi:hypothetical protein
MQLGLKDKFNYLLHENKKVLIFTKFYTFVVPTAPLNICPGPLIPGAKAISNINSFFFIVFPSERHQFV